MIIINGTYCDEKIVCPYCLYTFDDSYNYNEIMNGIIECKKCKKKIELFINVRVYYNTRRNCEINNKKHIYIKNNWDKNKLICKNCGEVKLKREKNIINKKGK